MSKLFGFLWLTWLVFFVTVETFGVPMHQSLSEWIWWATRHPVIRLPFGAFMLWLLLHLVFRIRA